MKSIIASACVFDLALVEAQVKYIQDPAHLWCGILAAMRTTSTVGTLALSLFLLSLRGQTTTPGQAPNLKPNQGVKITFQGYVRDLACLVNFDGVLSQSTIVQKGVRGPVRLW